MVQDPAPHAPWATVVKRKNGDVFVLTSGNLPEEQAVTLRGPSPFDFSFNIDYLDPPVREKTYSHKDGLPPCPGALEADPWEGYGCKYCGDRYHCGGCGRGSGMMGHLAGANKPMSCQPDEEA